MHAFGSFRLVGLSKVFALGIDDILDGSRDAGRSCLGCGHLPAVKVRETVELVDLPYAGRPSRLRWCKVGFICPSPDSDVLSRTWDDTRIDFHRQAAVRPSRPVSDPPGRLLWRPFHPWLRWPASWAARG